MSQSSGRTQRSSPRTSTSSTNTFWNAGDTTPGTTSASPARNTNTTESCEPGRRRASERPRLGPEPPRLNSGPRSNVIATPVNDWSNSASLTADGPAPGSLMYALPFENPSKTTKWLKFQCRIIGPCIVRRSAGSRLNPFASSP
jgi:hypothetical protein